MRSALTSLLIFAAGALLALLLSGHVFPTSPATATTASTTPASVQTVLSPVDSPAPMNDDWPGNGPSPEQVLYLQRNLVRAALGKLTPRVAGKPNLYLVTFAGDGGEDVFRNEAEYAARLFAERFGATSHSVVLENNPATLSTHPLASWSNLEDVLHGLGKIMKPGRDILMLYVTSHGDEDHDLLVDMDPLPLDQIGASDLAGILDRQPFKWKVLVINACYSGGFIPPLHGPGTLVLTAARTDRSSFGCGSDSDITYFGKAWLVDALNRTPDFIQAFKLANIDISQWEKQDKVTPSEPQIDIGAGIAGQLALWRKGFIPGPDVPFVPPSTPATASSASLRQ
ncbi:MAG: C13 family peptidase [Rhodanobacter sp.]